MLAFAVGAYVAAESGGMGARGLARSFAREWAARDYRAMYEQLDPGTRRGVSLAHVEGVVRAAAATATLVSARVVGATKALGGQEFAVTIRASTRMFGTLVLPYRLRITSHEGTPAVAWRRSVSFPGLNPGEQLTRTTNLPRRATLLADDGSVLAESPPGAAGEEAGARYSPLGAAAAAVVGTVGPVPADRLQELEAIGVPPQGPVGLSGLELAFDDRLRGTPGGELLAGDRVLASVAPRPASPMRTSVSPTLQQATVDALGGQYGGIVAMRPSGQILAVAGIGLEGLQPPGSTFKMVTVSGVLAAHLATPHTEFPYATFATLDGVKLNNANGEECGGTLETAFAVSCNSVFSPLGVKLGAGRLVASAESLGFNSPPGLPGAAESTLPSADEIHGELAVGSTAIGQGSVLATPLQMATVAATIADEGQRPQPTFLPRAQPPARRDALSATVARTVRRLMIGVVRDGTGTAAAIPGITVAGKTGTAELKTCPASQGPAHEAPAGGETQEGCGDENQNTDAWFAAFAPALDPSLVVCVLLVKDGAGGATAAPVAREVLEADLRGGA